MILFLIGVGALFLLLYLLAGIGIAIECQATAEIPLWLHYTVLMFMWPVACGVAGLESFFRAGIGNAGD